jgi:hypothetical protein
MMFKQVSGSLVRILILSAITVPGYAYFQSVGRGGSASTANQTSVGNANAEKDGRAGNRGNSGVVEGIPLVSSDGVSSFRELCRQADLIAEVVVESYYPGYISGGTAHTDSVLRIESVWKGTVESEKVIAGQLGQRQTDSLGRITTNAGFVQPGDRYIVFLTQATDGQQRLRPLRSEGPGHNFLGALVQVDASGLVAVNPKAPSYMKPFMGLSKDSFRSEAMTILRDLPPTGRKDIKVPGR